LIARAFFGTFSGKQKSTGKIKNIRKTKVPFPIAVSAL
jgi:hypothetical protein